MGLIKIFVPCYYVIMVAETITKNLYKVLQSIENPDGEFCKINFEKQGFCLKLKYSRQNFIEDTKKLLCNLNSSQKTEITSFFGFVLIENEQFTTFLGYPSVKNLVQENSPYFHQLFGLVEKFTVQNEICNKNYQIFSKEMNTILKAFPEFYTLIGKIQHHTHSYTVDIHTLKVLQGVMLNPLYKNLPKNDRRALQIAVLMHDITKKEGEIDKTHPSCAAKDTAFILNNIQIPSKQKEKICLLIRNHDWLERYNKGITPAKEFAEILKDGNNFEMLCILAESDLKAVQRNGVFYEKYCSVLDDGRKEISAILHKSFSAA